MSQRSKTRVSPSISLSNDTTTPNTSNTTKFERLFLSVLPNRVALDARSVRVGASKAADIATKLRPKLDVLLAAFPQFRSLR